MLYIKEYNTNANILSLGTNVMNIHGKQLKGLSNGTDLTDAVTL